MANRTFASLVPKVNPSVPGCPTQTIIQYIRDAAIRTCERTLAWRYQVPLYDLLPGVHEYAYNKPDSTDAHAIFAAIVNGSHLEKLTLDDALRLYPQWADLYSGEDPSVLWSLTDPSSFNTDDYNDPQYNDGSVFALPDSIVADASTPRSICQVTPDKYIILPLPDAKATYTMRMFLALKPKRNSTAMDEVIFDDLEESILHGALQHLLVLPNSHWTDRELAAYHAKQYVFQIAERRARANLGNPRGVLRAKMQPFGA